MVQQTVASRWAVLPAALIGLAMTIVFLITPLNGNIRYEAGVKQVSDFSAAGTFSHRPLAFRIWMDGLFRVARLAAGSGAATFRPAVFEFTLRLLFVLLAVAAGALLTAGLRDRGLPRPALYGALAGAAVLLVGAGSSGEPDWMAAVLTVAGTGVGLLGRRLPWLCAGLAAVLLVAASGMKLVTVATALLGLLVIAVVDRRRALRTMIAAVVVGLLYLAITVLLVPWEITWVLDIRAVQPAASHSLPHAVSFFLEAAVRWPAVALLPAAVLAAEGVRERLVMIIAVLLAAAPVIAQGQYFVYHGVPLCLVASMIVARTLSIRGERVSAVFVGLLTVAAALLTVPGDAWLTAHRDVWIVGLGIVLILSVLWARRAGRPTAGRPQAGLAPLVVGTLGLSLLLPVMTPYSADVLRWPDRSGPVPATNLSVRAQDELTAERVRAVVGGPGVEVTYLTFGEWTYFIGNPTDCRFPSPLFLQRTRFTARAQRTASFRANLACLSAPGSRWLIWQRSWFSPTGTAKQVRHVISAQWDCGQAVTVGELRLCPRRPAAPGPGSGR